MVYKVEGHRLLTEWALGEAFMVLSRTLVMASSRAAGRRFEAVPKDASNHLNARDWKAISRYLCSSGMVDGSAS